MSGLGPNGMLAALKLRAEGFDVVAADQRPAYNRSIHLNLRRSWLETVRSLDATLAEKLAAVTTPIRAFERLPHHDAAPFRLKRESALARRLATQPELHVRLDELERVFCAHLVKLPGIEVLTHTRVTVDGSDVRLGDRRLEAPALIVAAEGGKSPTARQLGLSMVKVSAPRFYISVHVDHSVGPITRRLDVDGLSSWAVGHGDPARGTWLVLEIPEKVHAGRPSSTIDREHFERGARQLLGVVPEPSAEGLRGTFRFEQQLLPRPVAGSNVLFLGDSAGMGHHALGTGLELGAWDIGFLRKGMSLEDHAARVVEARIELLAFGMHEYYPSLAEDPTEWIRQAITQGTDAVSRLEARLTGLSRRA
ncbi:MAG: hypothetical protein JNK82_36950 [Myxococcaceae bacterium]|nr:hypothetical protein [Myxococcaceae bacterium]